jgi:hypothetical protein
MRRTLALVGVAATISAGTAAIAAAGATSASALDPVTWCKGLPPGPLRDYYGCGAHSE